MVFGFDLSQGALFQSSWESAPFQSRSQRSHSLQCRRPWEVGPGGQGVVSPNLFLPSASNQIYPWWPKRMWKQRNTTNNNQDACHKHVSKSVFRAPIWQHGNGWPSFCWMFLQPTSPSTDWGRDHTDGCLLVNSHPAVWDCIPPGSKTDQRQVWVPHSASLGNPSRSIEIYWDIPILKLQLPLCGSKTLRPLRSPFSISHCESLWHSSHLYRSIFQGMLQPRDGNKNMPNPKVSWFDAENIHCCGQLDIYFFCMYIYIYIYITVLYDYIYIYAASSYIYTYIYICTIHMQLFVIV